MADIIVERDGQVFQFAANTPPDVQERRIANYLGKSRTEPPKSLPMPSPDVEAEIPAKDVPLNALKNLAPSVVEKAGDLAQAVTSPVQTGKGIVDLAFSGPMYAASKIRDLLGMASDEDRADLARNQSAGRHLWDHYANSYGSWKGFKKYASEDPAGVILDATLPFGGGARPAAGVPGVPRAAAATGKALENATAATLGWSTGAGKEAIDQMVAAGRAGNRGPLDHMRGNASYRDVVDEMRGALDKLRHDRSAEYVRNMASVRGSAAVIPFTNIDAAMASAADIGSFKGVNLETNPSVLAARERIQKVVDDWRALDPDSELFKGKVNPADLTPANYHTPAGMDALKQIIGNIRDAVPMNDVGYRPIHKYASDIYRTIRGEIAAADPSYAKAMADYEKASEFLTEATKSLSLGKNAAADTSLRKLQSVFRNNVNTNFGNRSETLRELLAKSGKSGVMADIAGQQLSAPLPRGIGRLMAGPVPAAAAATMLSPKALALAPLMSPRLMGEASHAYGRNIRGIGQITGLVGEQATQAANIARLLEDSDAYGDAP